MPLTFEKATKGRYTFYKTRVFYTDVTLSKSLVESLKKLKVDKTDDTHFTAHIPPEMECQLMLTAQTVTKGSKTYTNLYLTVRKQLGAGAVREEDLPF